MATVVAREEGHGREGTIPGNVEKGQNTSTTDLADSDTPRQPYFIQRTHSTEGADILTTETTIWTISSSLPSPNTDYQELKLRTNIVARASRSCLMRHSAVALGRQAVLNKMKQDVTFLQFHGTITKPADNRFMKYEKVSLSPSLQSNHGMTD